jgi:RNA polymerase sigma-70 factor (ECF subfamily)
LRGDTVVVQDPDGGSLDELFNREYPRLVRSLTVVCGDREAAADAVQDAFVQAHRHWGRISGYDDPAGWVRRAALNRLANRARGDRRRWRFVARAHTTGTPTEGIDRAGSIDSGLDLTDAIRALPDGQRAAIALHYLADLSVAEVAAALGVSTGTVKSQLHDARAALGRHPALASKEIPDGT